MNNSVLKVYILIVWLFNLSLTASYSQEPSYGIVNQSVINLKTTFLYSSEMSSQALMGTPVQILETANGWCHLKTPEGYTAWATEESIKKLSLTDLNTWKVAKKIIVTSYFEIIRLKPTENSKVISDVVCGNILLYKARVANYFKVALPDGRIGYLKSANAMIFNQWLAKRNYSAKSIVTIANYFIGFPYLWGGTSIKGMDCSGFTKTCFFLNGIILPRDASQQAVTGENIDISKDFSQLQPADLLFFGSKVEGKEQIIHVAIYIGNGEFIHSSGMVKIGSLYSNNLLYDAYNTNRILRAQRILTHIDKDENIISIEKHPFYQK